MSSFAELATMCCCPVSTNVGGYYQHRLCTPILQSICHDMCVCVCLVLCVCVPMTADRNDLKHGTVVVLDTMCRSLLIRLRVSTRTSISAHIKYLLLLKFKTGVFKQPLTVEYQ